MPFPQMVLGYHCLSACSFAVWFLNWLNFIPFCTIQYSGLLAFRLFLPVTAFAFSLSIMICKYDDHEFYIFTRVVA